MERTTSGRFDSDMMQAETELSISSLHVCKSAPSGVPNPMWCHSLLSTEEEGKKDTTVDSEVLDEMVCNTQPSVMISTRDKTRRPSSARRFAHLSIKENEHN
jgi:hypothetical protein